MKPSDQEGTHLVVAKEHQLPLVWAQHNQCLRSYLDTIGRDPNVSKSNQSHVDIFHYFFILLLIIIIISLYSRGETVLIISGWTRKHSALDPLLCPKASPPGTGHVPGHPYWLMMWRRVGQKRYVGEQGRGNWWRGALWRVQCVEPLLCQVGGRESRPGYRARYTDA